MARYGYVRVSTAGQNDDRQMERMQRLGLDKIFNEKKSGKTLDRPVLQGLLELVEPGDEIVIYDYSRISRSTKDLLNLIEELQEKNVTLTAIKDNIAIDTAQGRFLLKVMAAVNEMELELRAERQAEGIAIAKEKGMFKGRHTVPIKSLPKYKERLEDKTMTKTEVCAILKISRPTLDRHLKEYNQIYQ